MNTNFGVNAWGISTVVLAIAALLVVVLGGVFLGLDGKFVKEHLGG